MNKIEIYTYTQTSKKREKKVFILQHNVFFKPVFHIVVEKMVLIVAIMKFNNPLEILI